MGAGKTTVGKQLAKLLSLSFVDLDAEIESRCGADIEWIFDVEEKKDFGVGSRRFFVKLRPVTELL